MAKFRRQHNAGQAAKAGSMYAKVGFLVLLIGAALFGYRYFISPDADSSIEENIETNNQAPNLPAEKVGPTPGSWLPYAEYGEVIVDQDFSLAYSEQHEQAIWVAHELRGDQLRSHEAERSDWFEEDPRVTSGSARHADYIKSGYTRGHLAPSADFVHDQEAMDKSFFMSNISPQVYHFNGGVWRELEENVRDWARLNDRLLVVTGPILDNNPKKLGKNKVSVPKAFYKVILDTEEPEKKGIAFLIPHEKTDKPLDRFAISIRELEDISGINFYMDLYDQKLQDSLELNNDIRQWPVNAARFEKRVNIWNKEKSNHE
jgi:endonuclease G